MNKTQLGQTKHIFYAVRRGYGMVGGVHFLKVGGSTQVNLRFMENSIGLPLTLLFTFTAPDATRDTQVFVTCILNTEGYKQTVSYIYNYNFHLPFELMQ